MPKQLAHCPDCGKLNSIVIQEKDIKRERKLPCDHCDNGGAQARTWKERVIE